MTETLAPLLKQPSAHSRGYPIPEYPLGRAWTEAYGLIKDATEPVDGRLLAVQVALKHDLDPLTLVGLFSRMAKGGHLERVPKPVKLTMTKPDGRVYQSTRTRTFYQIPTGE